MATQAFAGYNGKLYISTDSGSSYDPIGEVRDATLTISSDEMEATSFDSAGWKEFIPGMKEWELSTEALYIYSDVGQDALYNALVSNPESVVKMRLLPKTGTGNQGYEGDVFIVSWEINNTVDDVVVLSVDFRGSGALATYTAA